MTSYYISFSLRFNRFLLRWALIIFVCFFIQKPLVAQNLVIDGSFEDTILTNGFPSPRHWNINLASPDYFTKHYSPPFDSTDGIPFNIRGYQESKDGDAYFGFGVLDFNNSDYREYLQAKFSSPLLMGEDYLITFWVSLADRFHLAIDHSQIGISLSQNEYLPNPNSTFQNVLNYSSDSAFNSKDNQEWHKFQFIYSAIGNEEYMIIGCFVGDNSLIIDSIGGTSSLEFHKKSSYYFIDAISCSPITNTLEYSDDYYVKCYPNPASNYLTIKFNGIPLSNFDLKIYDQNGRKINIKPPFQISPGTYQLDLSNLNSGVYILSLTDTKSSIITKKILVAN